MQGLTTETMHVTTNTKKLGYQEKWWVMHKHETARTNKNELREWITQPLTEFFTDIQGNPFERVLHNITRNAATCLSIGF